MAKVIELRSVRKGEGGQLPEAFRNPDARFGGRRMTVSTLFEISKLMKKDGLDKQFYGFFRAMANDVYEMLLQGANVIGYSDDLHHWYLEKSGLKNAYEAISEAFSKHK